MGALEYGLLPGGIDLAGSYSDLLGAGYLIGLLPKAPVTWEPPECPIPTTRPPGRN